MASYREARAQCADFIEPDLLSTSDHVLVVRHDNELGQTTDIADHAEFAQRRTTKMVDGHEYEGWFARTSLRPRSPLSVPRNASRKCVPGVPISTDASHAAAERCAPARSRIDDV